jgi:hypothetical protein
MVPIYMKVTLTRAANQKHLNFLQLGSECSGTITHKGFRLAEGYDDKSTFIDFEVGNGCGISSFLLLSNPASFSFPAFSKRNYWKYFRKH